MSSIEKLKQFDKSQFWRFFVDGRFQKKYNGWVGYEAGERGSVQALLNGFLFMLDHFDLSKGLSGTYLRELHKVCMLNVETTNLKSSPGDIRYLNSGMPFFAKSTTYEHLVEVFDMRKGDGTAIFNNQKYGKTANELDIDDVYSYMLKAGKINYRNWYPQLDYKLTRAIEGKATLHEFYQAKHTVQMLMVSEMEAIINKYNKNIKLAKSDEEKLAVIALVPREMELLHPFPDGNSRTFSCVTLTHLLLYHGFTPAILENPNLDNEVSLSQWIEEIKQGIERTEKLILEPNARIFDYSIVDMSEQDKKNFLGMASELVTKINQHQEIFLTPQRLAEYTQGQWINNDCDENLRFTGVGTYGTFSQGNVYFAMAIKDWIKEGKNVGAELKRVQAREMRAVVIDDLQYAKYINEPILLVNDCFEAFKQAACKVRKEQNPYTVLVTGTEGKTGAKVQFHHLLNFQVKTHAVLNSANTEVPVLRSLINLSNEEIEINEVSVGSNEAYRVERSIMVSPDLCFFTNIGPNHMDMHKTIENIIDAKSSVVEGLREGGKCIVNSDIEHYPKLLNAINRRRPKTPVLTYGRHTSDSATLIEQTFSRSQFGWNVKADISGETVEYFLPLFQQHAPLSSVGILLAIKEMGYSVVRAAEAYQGLVPFETMGRMFKFHKRSGDVYFYDQSRRGGLHGMRSAFDDMQNFKIKGKVVALIGGISTKKDSGWTKEAHSELATMVNKSNIKKLYTTGNFMEYVIDELDDPSIFVKHSDNLDELAKLLFNTVKGGDMLFIIGNAYLYLGRVADKILKIKDKSKFDYQIYDYSLDDKLIQQYKALVSIEEEESGRNIQTVLAQYDLALEYFNSFKSSYHSFTDARASILMKFFEELNHSVISYDKLQNVSQEVSETGGHHFVLNKSHCLNWFNNLDQIENAPKKQLFGSFYYFGDEHYLLHIMVATMNLHIGLVKYQKHQGKIQVLKMQEQDQNDVQLKYNKQFEKNIVLEKRSWGLKWCSHDCGKFIDLTHATVYSTMVSLDHSELNKKVIVPVLEKLNE